MVQIKLPHKNKTKWTLQNLSWYSCQLHRPLGSTVENPSYSPLSPTSVTHTPAVWIWRRASDPAIQHLNHAVVVQPLSCVQLFATPWTSAHQASLSFTVSWSSLKLMSMASVMPSNHLILCHPLLPLPSWSCAVCSSNIPRTQDGAVLRNVICFSTKSIFIAGFNIDTDNTFPL